MSNDTPKTPRSRELEELKNLKEEEAALPGEYGVLLSDQIQKCVDEFDLIRPFHPDQLKPASYRLRVGEQYALGGEKFALSAEGAIKIEPFQVVVIQTLERLNLPRNMIARWNIKVGRAYEGLIWAGGPQVDPGYEGHLFCPIYNLSDKPVSLRLGEEIAVIDFIRTTAFNKVSCKEFPRPPHAVVLEEYKTDWQSGLYSLVRKRMDDLDQKVKTMEGTFQFFVAITLAVMGVLVAAASINPKEPPYLSSLPTVLGLSALTVSLFTLLKGTAIPAAALKTWWRLLLFVLCGLAFGGVCWWLGWKFGLPLR